MEKNKNHKILKKVSEKNRRTTTNKKKVIFVQNL